MNKFLKSVICSGLFFTGILFLAVVEVKAASLEVSPSSATFKKGCKYTVDIVLNTEGENSNAADLILNYDPTEIEVLDSNPGRSGIQVQEGDVYEFYPGNIVDSSVGEIKVTGSNFMSSFAGQGVFARIEFKSLANVDTTDLNIYFTGADPYNSLDSNVADAATSYDLLSSVQDGHFAFTEGFCFTDTQPPKTKFKYPKSNQGDIPADADIRLDISDSLSGVDIDTVDIILNGTKYKPTDSEISYTGNYSKYSFILNPGDPILTDSANTLITKATDLSGNYKRSSINFNIPEPPPPPPPPPPDTDSPLIEFDTPVNRSTIPLDSSIKFTVSDEDSGIDINTLEIILNSREFLYETSTLFSVDDLNNDQSEYEIIFTPEEPLPDSMSTLAVFVEDKEGNGAVKSIIFNETEVEETVCVQDPDIPEDIDEEKLKECIEKQVVVQEGGTRTVTKTITETLDPVLKDVPKNNLNQAASAAMVGTTALNLWLLAFELARLPYFLIQLFFSILSFLGLRKKGKPYGVVYNSVTKEPLSNAIVRIYNAAGKLVRTDVTNIYGIFTADLEPGKYRFEVNTPGFKFPSTLLSNTPTDSQYQNNYYGDLVQVEKDEPEYSIPLDPVSVPKYRSVMVRLRSSIGKFVKILSPILLVIGFTMTLFTLIRYNDVYSKILIVLYIPSILLSLHNLLTKVKKYGIIKSSDKQGVKNVEVGLKDLNYDRVVGKRITDQNGFYRFIVSPGSYEIVILDDKYKPEDENITVKEKKKMFKKNSPMIINNDIDVNSQD